MDLGHWSDASGLVVEVLADPGASVPQQIVARVAGGLLAIRTGDEERGRQLLDEALAQALPTGELQRLAPVAAARAEAAWLRRDLAAIDGETAAAAELAALREQPWELGELAVWRARAGLGFPAGETAPPFAAELAGDPAGAALLWDELGCTFQAALARIQAGDEARLRDALGELQRLGALPVARLVARRLRELGARDIPRGPLPATHGECGRVDPTRARGAGAAGPGAAQRGRSPSGWCCPRARWTTTSPRSWASWGRGRGARRRPRRAGSA